MGRMIVRYRDRPWWDGFVALAFFAVALVLYATGFYAVSPATQLPMWLLLTQSTVLCVAQMFRRRLPLTMLGLGIFAAVGASVPGIGPRSWLSNLIFRGPASWSVKADLSTFLMGCARGNLQSSPKWSADAQL